MSNIENSKSNKLKLVREISIKADSPEFRENSKMLGEKASKIFSEKAQIKKLENTANFALKVTDIYNYIKRQTGKDTKGKNWRSQEFGSGLLKSLEELENNDGKDICKNLDISSPAEKMQVNLLLAREFIRQLVVHYEYETRGKK